MYDENSLQKIGSNISLLRTMREINQGELAKNLNISQTHMSNIEHGRVQVTLRLLLRMANVFQCRLDDFLEMSLRFADEKGMDEE